MAEAIQEYHDTKPRHENTEENEQLGLQEKNRHDERSARRATPKKDYKFNYFIALQITNKTLIDKLVKVQRHISQDNPTFKPFEIPLKEFHLILNLMKLCSDREVAHYVSTLKNMQSDLLKLTKAAGCLEFDSLGHFSNRVIFARPRFNHGLQKLADRINDNLAMAGIKNEVQMSPHLTLFKMSWSEMNAFRSSGVQMWVRLRDSEQMLGYQWVDNISLCEMGGKTDDGFYRKAYDFKLSDFDL